MFIIMISMLVILGGVVWANGGCYVWDYGAGCYSDIDNDWRSDYQKFT